MSRGYTSPEVAGFFMALDTSGSDSTYNNGVSTGQNAINSFDPTGTASNQQAGSSSLFNKQQGQTNDYISNYAKTVAANPTVTSLYNEGNNIFNVPQLKETATNLNNEVTNAVASGYAGARGFDIGDAQVQNGVAKRLGYLLPQSNAATANANTASELAQGFVNAGVAQNQQNLLPVQAEAPFLQQEQGVQGNIWTQANANEFQGLINKMNAGVTLSSAEIQRANQLAQLEEAYQQAVTTANIGNQYKEVGKGNTLFNTFANTAINPGIATSNSSQGVAKYG